MNAPEWEKLSASSPSLLSVRAAQLMADLHQRASVDAETLLRELVEDSTELNFYAEPTGAFDAGSVDAGLISATHTALVWIILRRDQQFPRAIASRDVLCQAKGMLMERFDVDAAAAFVLLKRMSQDSNTPISLLAQRVVAGDHSRR